MNEPSAESPPRPSRPPHSRRLRVVLALVLAASVALVLGLWLHRHGARAREAAQRNDAANRGPVVLVAPATVGSGSRDIVLPADVRAMLQTSLYAKVSGYVRTIKVDKGDHVKKGQLVGTLESPETDQALEQARANVVLREQEASRAKRLAPQGVVSQADLEAAIANLKVAQAALAQATQTKQYEDLRAPFDGVVTARYVDPGALLPAATGSTQAALPFVDVADPTTLRVMTYVGQDAAPFVKVGDAVVLWEDARPDRKIAAKVTRTSDALDPRTRTMLVEVDLDNREYGVLPGTFAHARIHVDAPALPTVPNEAVFVRNGKTTVGVVADGRVRMTNVATGVTDGRTVQIAEGLRGGETVALNLPTEVGDGAPVQAKAAPAGSAGTTPRPPSTSARRPQPKE